MEIAIAAALIAWLITSAVDRAKAEYGHERDRHLKQIQKDHPDWSPRRQQRLAKHRARGYWAHEIGAGFPTMRSAFKENRELARVERAEAEAAGAKRWAEYRKRLEAAQAEREKYVADQVKQDPATDKAGARKAWFDRHKLAGALRAGATATKLELGGNVRPTTDQPHRPPQVSPPDETPSPGREGHTRRVGDPADPDAPRVPCAHCGTRDGDRYMRLGSLVCEGCLDLARAREDLRDAQEEQSGEGYRSRLEQRAERLASEQERRRAATGWEAPGAPQTGKRPAMARCATCNTPVDKLYPSGGIAVCTDCLTLANSRARLSEAREDAAFHQSQVAASTTDSDRTHYQGLVNEARQRATRAEQECRDGLRAAETRRAAARASNGQAGAQPEAGGQAPHAASPPAPGGSDLGGEEQPAAELLHERPGLAPDLRKGMSPEEAAAHNRSLPAETRQRITELNERVAAAPTAERRFTPTSDQLAALYETYGHAPDEARRLADDHVRRGIELYAPKPPETGADAGTAQPAAGADTAQAEPSDAPPPAEAGANESTDGTGGQMEAPNIDAAHANASGLSSQLGTVSAGLEQMEADLIAGGLDNDQGAMEKFAAAKESVLNAQAASTGFVGELGKHAAGQEYANSGHAAKTDFLKSN